MNEIRTREIQFALDENTISGMAIVFNQMSEVLYDTDSHKYFREVISPEALTQEFIDTQDVQLNLDHDRNKVLARRRNCSGSMDIKAREDGVVFSTSVPKTQLGRDTYEMIKRGDYSSMSFAYVDGDNKGDITWDFSGDIPVRTVHKIRRLADLSIVFSPAYTQTSVTARSMDEAKPEKIEINIQDEQKREIDESYIDDLKPYKEIISEF